MDDLLLGGGGIGGGALGGMGAGFAGLNGKLMGVGPGTNPLAAIFAASNASGIHSNPGLQQVKYRNNVKHIQTIFLYLIFWYYMPLHFSVYIT